MGDEGKKASDCGEIKRKRLKSDDYLEACF